VPLLPYGKKNEGGCSHQESTVLSGKTEIAKAKMKRDDDAPTSANAQLSTTEPVGLPSTTPSCRRQTCRPPAASRRPTCSRVPDAVAECVA